MLMPTSNKQKFSYRRAKAKGKLPLFVSAGDDLIYVDEITSVDISSVENEIVVINTKHGKSYTAVGFDAIEAVMLFKPSALEGRKLIKWNRNAWTFHNWVGHPVMDLLAKLGFKSAAIRFHDWTTPAPRKFKP
jgi:hypothetical protein